MSLILKLRHEKLTGSLSNVNHYTQQNKKIQTNLNTLFNNALITSKNTFKKSFNLIETWLHNTVENTEKKHFVGLNKKYILVVGESKLSENLFLNALTPEIYKNIYMYSGKRLLCWPRPRPGLRGEACHGHGPVVNYPVGILHAGGCWAFPHARAPARIGQ